MFEVIKIKLLVVFSLIMLSGASYSIPLCQYQNNNIDANGWGWENGETCVVSGSSAARSINPQCSATVIDYDGDGWAWEAGRSCRVGVVTANAPATAAAQSAAPADIPACSSATTDPDGDGWGYENGQSCLVMIGSSSSEQSAVGASSSVARSDVPACRSNDSDPDGDGWGYEQGRSCRVGGASSVQASSPASESIANGRTPTGVRFLDSTLRRVGGSGDNWCQTWAADDSVITAMDDGEWLRGGYVYHSQLYKIFGDADNFSRSEVSNYPNFHVDGDGWFAYGMLSVKGVLYSLVTKTQHAAWSEGPFRGMKMLRSYDNGSTWHRVDRNNNDRYLARWDIGREELNLEEMFFFEESGRYGKGKTAFPFAFATFVQSGQDHRASRDGYVYIYSPEGANTHQLQLARVPEDQVGNRAAWQYFSGWNNGNATWSSDLEARQPNMVLPERNSAGEYFGFYSWLPSVVWNPGLQKYIMVNGGTYGGHNRSNSTDDYYNKWMHSRTGSLGLWYSDTPYGPWNQFYYTDYWTVDDTQNLTYQPKLSPKWMSDDGRTMTLIWSDAMRNAQGFSHSVNYKWNQMEIEIQTR